jgi:hypothetical protein
VASPICRRTRHAAPGPSTPASRTWSAVAQVKELVRAIGAFTGSWNEHPVPFAWTKDADEILGKIERAKNRTNVLTRQ